MGGIFLDNDDLLNYMLLYGQKKQIACAINEALINFNIMANFNFFRSSITTERLLWEKI